MAFEVRSEQSGDFLRLARLWQRGKTHSWIFVALDVAQERDAFIQRLNALAAGGCVSVQPGQTARDLEHALTQSHQFERLHIVLEPGCIWDAPWWQDANTLRERLADAFAKPLVFWLPDDAVTAAARYAPDLWNWRETVIDLNRRIAFDMPATRTPVFDGVTTMDKQAVLERLTELEAFFSANAALEQVDSNSPSVGYLKLEAARAYERLGRWEDATACVKDASALFERLDNLRMLAQAKGQIADILQARGKLDEALAIRQNDELPVYEQLGDIRESAMTKGKIADILQARGKLNEALAIWQRDVLPVFEQAGYVHDAKRARQRIKILQRQMHASPASGLLQALLRRGKTMP